MQMKSLKDSTDCDPEWWAARSLVENNLNQTTRQKANMQTAAVVRTRLENSMQMQHVNDPIDRNHNNSFPVALQYRST